MNLLMDQYNEARQRVFDYFGYVEDWAIIPLDDQTDTYWHLDWDEKEQFGEVRFAQTLEDLHGDGEAYYTNEVYTQRHLPKWVYRGADYTMICVDTRTDGNKLLQIFDNAKEQRELDTQ